MYTTKLKLLDSLLQEAFQISNLSKMAPTIEDLLEFLKKDKLERAEEREHDKKELKELISDGVKKEVASLIEPINARVDTVEKAQEDMSSQLKVMSDEIKELRDQLKSKDGQARGELSQTQPSSQPSNAPSGPGRVSEPIQTCTVNGSDQSELLEIISLGRRTVGLHKIDRADLERMRQEQYGGAKTEEQERLLAVQEYLRCELKIDSDMIKSMAIERIFPPPVGEPSHLYVTFRHESAVAKIFERTRLMRSGSRILYYVPRQFKYRAKAIREIEYQLRHAEKFQTRIKMGLNEKG